MQRALDVSIDAVGAPHEVAVKLQGGDDWELNVWSTFADLARLRDIRSAIWVERRSIAAGTSAGGRVFWAGPSAADVETASILIGQDDETWDIAIQVPVTVVEEIGRRAEAREAD